MPRVRAAAFEAMGHDPEGALAQLQRLCHLNVMKEGPPRVARSVEVGAAPLDGDGLRGFTRGVERRHGPIVVRAAIESMNGARFVHDTLERCEPPGPTGSRTSTGRTRPHERVLASATGRCPVRPAR